MRRHAFLSLFIAAVGLSAVPTYVLAEPEYEIREVAGDLDSPWGIAFLPNGDHLVTELGGTLRLVSADGSARYPIAGVPEVYRAGQGGLFDVLLAEDFETSQTLYLIYAAGDSEANATTVARARLRGKNLTDVTVIYEAAPKKRAGQHYGGRMVWLGDGTLLLVIGDGFDFREQAQNLDSHLGKTIRINADGTPAAGNPFPNAPYVWSYGHRNPQGLIVTAQGVVMLHEHGPRGGDEVNVVERGFNYGWPIATYGIDYNGAYVSPFTEYEGTQQPAHVWTPSIAPSGFMIYEGDMFPDWRGDLFVGALVDREVRRLRPVGDAFEESVVFPEISARIRDVKQAPDGSIYVLTDGAGGDVLRIQAAE